MDHFDPSARTCRVARTTVAEVDGAIVKLHADGSVWEIVPGSHEPRFGGLTIRRPGTRREFGVVTCALRFDEAA